MTWRTMKVEDQRKEFIDNFLDNKRSVSDLCREFQISRKTAYKWIHRFRNEGIEGLKDKSKAPHNQAGKTNEVLINEIVQIKNKYPRWGPKKIRALLVRNGSSENCPSTTTIGNILDKKGLVIPRKYRRRFPSKTNPLSHCTQPNDIWCIDFKGWFRTKDNVKCDPLTLTDAYSRFILCCSKLYLNTADYVWEVLSNAFYEYGLPIYLRHDNGPPFATCGAGRLSRLSVKLIKAGIIPEWIEPGKPQQNARHERMHSTLQQEGIIPLKLTLNEQEKKFKEFIRYFNYERPHEGINQEIPGNVYVPSKCVWTGKFKSPEYPERYIIKKVRDRGQMSWNGRDLYIGKTLKNEYVGIKEDNQGNWQVYFGPVLLGVLNEENQFICPSRAHRKRSQHKTRVY